MVPCFCTPCAILFLFLKGVIIIENISYEEYQNALENKETVRKALLDIRFQIAINKFNPEALNELIPKEQDLINKMKENQVLIRTYEIENDIERGVENDQHKGK